MLTREQESVIIITVIRIVTLRGFTLKTCFLFFGNNLESFLYDGGIMFGFLKNKKIYEIYAPADGKVIPLEEVNDKVFSEKLMGDGVAFRFSGDTLYSPCDGKVSMIFPTKHAIGFVCDNGAELLLHIGFNTVELNGEGFTCLVTAGERIKAHDPIMKINTDRMKEKGIDLTTPLVITNTDAYQINHLSVDEVCKTMKVMEITKE